MRSYESSPTIHHLTEDVITQLEQGPGLVREPVALELMSSEQALYYFKGRMLGNFSGYFASASSTIGSVYRQTHCRQRFALIYPQETAELESLVAMGATTVSPPGGVVDQRFVDAYERMRQLVDHDDPAVVQQGKVDNFYLLH